jgi:hypothetical protein
MKHETGCYLVPLGEGGGRPRDCEQRLEFFGPAVLQISYPTISYLTIVDSKSKRQLFLQSDVRPMRSPARFDATRKFVRGQ